MTRILCCDDATVITRAISLKLRKSGYDVETACDGMEGWEAAQRETPALVITDYQMPRMDGLELVRHLRDYEATQSIPIILLTAKGFELDSQQLIEELKLTALLPKPFSPSELLEVVRSSLEEQPRDLVSN